MDVEDNYYYHGAPRGDGYHSARTSYSPSDYYYGGQDYYQGDVDRYNCLSPPMPPTMPHPYWVVVFTHYSS